MNVVFGFKEFAFLLTGLKWTVLLSLIAFAGASLAQAPAQPAQGGAMSHDMMGGHDMGPHSTNC